MDTTLGAQPTHGHVLTRSPYFVGSPATHPLAKRAHAASSAWVFPLEAKEKAQKKAGVGGWGP